MADTSHEEAPPSYDQATGSSASSSRLHPNSAAGHERNGIPISARRSMEDERRPLPKGWIRQFDAGHQHQFFVDTRQDPPRSIWHHPYDDEQYLSTLSSEERERIQDETRRMQEDGAGYSSDEADGKGGPSQGRPSHPRPSQAPAAPQSPMTGQGPQGQPTFGRKLKDRITGTTHEQREQSRRERFEQEQQAYAMHQKFRQAMARAQQTGQPQFVCRGPRGRDIYVEPPYGARAPAGSHGVNPYAQGPYTNPNARFIRPEQVYGRPYGGGYGGGLGGPLAFGGLAGAAGGLLLGGLLF